MLSIASELWRKSLGALGRGAVSALAVNSGGVLLAFALQVVLARVMLPSELGAYSLALSWFGVLLIVGGAGVEFVIVRFGAQYAARGQWGEVRALMRWGTRVSLRVTLAVVLVLLAVLAGLQKTLPVQLAAPFWAGALFLPVWVLLILRQALLRSLKRIAASRIPDVVVRPALFLLLLLIAAQFEDGRLSGGLGMWLHTLAGGAALAAGWSVFAAKMPAAPAAEAPPQRRAEWRGAALPLLLVSIFTVIQNEFDKIGLGWTCALGEVGVYSVAARLSMFAAFGVDSIGAIAVPLLSEFYATRSRDELQKLVRKVAVGMALSSCGIALLLIVCGGPLLMLFGADYGGAYRPLVLLCAGQAIAALYGPGGFLLLVAGKHRELVATLLLSLAAAVVAVLCASYYFGAIGAAGAAATALVLRCGLYSYQCRRHLGVSTTVGR